MKKDRRRLLRNGLGALAAAAVGGEAYARPRRPGGPRPSAATGTAPQFGGGDVSRDDGWIGVDVAALAANLATVKERAGGRPVMAVVKANGYGHGLELVASALAEAGADAFMVGNVAEAVALKEAGIARPVLNFGRVYDGAAVAVIEHGVEQMVSDRDTVSSMVASAAQRQSQVAVHVHVDTGMGRMGVPWQEAAELIEYVAGRSRLQLRGVSTTLSEDPDFDREQISRFRSVCDAATAAGVDIGLRHAASSAALLGMPDAHLDMVRPGIALYGHYPSESARAAEPELLAPTLGVRARVAEVRQLAAGDSVGYHRVYTAEAPETIAVLPIGYSDGYPPEVAAGGGSVWVSGRRCPLVGEVTANHCMVRVPEGLEIYPGSFAVPLGNGSEARMLRAGDDADPVPLAHEVAAWAGISVYQLHIRLSGGLPRRSEGARRR